MENGESDPTEVIVVAEAEADTAADEGAADQVVSDGALLEATEETPADQTVSERVEDVARAAGVVAFRGADVVAARRQPDVRKAFLDVASLAVVAVAALTAFAFANWALASALTTVVSDWFAGIILAAIWIAIAVLVAAFFFRGEREIRSLRRLLAKDVSDTLPERLAALEEANQTLHDRLDQLAEAIATAAQERIAAAILPVAGGMVEVGEEMVDATDEVIEKADEITDAIEENVPGGVIVNRAVDFVLVPGKFGIRVARSVLSLGQPPK